MTDASIRRRSHPPALSLTTTMAAAVPHLPAVLARVAARKALDDITDRIPAALTRRAYLECRLGEAAPAVDIVFCVDAASRTLLAEPLRAWLPDHLRAHPVWKGLDRLCLEWMDRSSRLGRGIYDLWLEFDAQPGCTELQSLVPSVFVGLSRGVSTGPLEFWESAVAYVEIIMGRPVDPVIATAAREVVERLPAGATLPYVGLMYPRNQRAIRLCAAPMAGVELIEYLTAVGWRGDVDGVEALLRSIPHGCATAFDSTTLLHVDVLDDIQPRIGLEIPLAQYPQVVGGINEVEVLDALCRLGLCAAEKRDALLRWPGHAMEQFPHQCWPSLALRRVSHVKLVCEPGREPEAKTYLSFFHQFSRRSAPGRERPGTPCVVPVLASRPEPSLRVIKERT